MRTFTPLEEALGRGVAGMVNPVIRRGTRLIDLYVMNRDPVMAQRLADAIGREYIRNSIERRASLSEESLRYLLEEEERLKLNLQKSEAAVAEYKAKNPDALQLGGGTAATGSQTGRAPAGVVAGGLVEDKLQDINSKLAAAKADRLRLEGELRQIEQTGDNIDLLLAIPSISNAALVTAAQRNITQVEAAIATLSLRYKEKHPRMMAARPLWQRRRKSFVRRPWRNLRFCVTPLSKSRRPKPVCKGRCKTSRAWLSRSTAQRSDIRNWPGRLKPIARSTKAFCARSKTQI